MPLREGTLMVNATVYEKLIQIAKARKTIAYGELAMVADVLVEGDDDMKSVGFILDAIADQELAAGRPLLPIVVVSGKTNMPGGGLFKYAKRKKLQKVDDLTFFATELNRVYDYWAQAGDGGH
jgi:hypothetical protein